MKVKTDTPQYGNWISIEFIEKIFILFLIFGTGGTLLWIFLPGWVPLKITITSIAIFFLVSTIYFYYSRRLFSENGGNIQNKVLNKLIEQIDWKEEGNVLDIGCGSAALTIKLAKKFEKANFTGIDYWTGAWGYKKNQCEENALIEKVDRRTKFLKASASKLPFDDKTFDLVVSNLTFHEVKDSKNKLAALAESIRVLKKEGRFVFQDLFLIKAYYGSPDELITAVKNMGVKEVHFIDTSKSEFIPKSLKLPFMLGTIGIIYGVK